MSALLKDLKTASGGGVASGIYTWLFDANFKAIKLYRQSHWLNERLHLQILPRLLNIRSRKKYAIDIDFGAEIGPYFSIKHGAGIVIGRWVKAGHHLTMYQGVTLGGNSGKERNLGGATIVQPQLGDNVKLYAGCTVIGPVIVGNNSEVGAGTIVTKDVPDNHVAFSKQELVLKEKIGLEQ